MYMIRFKAGAPKAWIAKQDSKADPAALVRGSRLEPSTELVQEYHTGKATERHARSTTSTGLFVIHSSPFTLAFGFDTLLVVLE